LDAVREAAIIRAGPAARCAPREALPSIRLLYIRSSAALPRPEGGTRRTRHECGTIGLFLSVGRSRKARRRCGRRLTATSGGIIAQQSGARQYSPRTFTSFMGTHGTQASLRQCTESIYPGKLKSCRTPCAERLEKGPPLLPVYLVPIPKTLVPPGAPHSFRFRRCCKVQRPSVSQPAVAPCRRRSSGFHIPAVDWLTSPSVACGLVHPSVPAPQWLAVVVAG